MQVRPHDGRRGSITVQSRDGELFGGCCIFGADDLFRAGLALTQARLFQTRADRSAGSTSGASGLGSGGIVSSTWDLRSAAFSIRTAARSGLLVDLANLRSVAA